jgi:hypothetical protein
VRRVLPALLAVLAVLTTSASAATAPDPLQLVLRPSDAPHGWPASPANRTRIPRLPGDTSSLVAQATGWLAAPKANTQVSSYCQVLRPRPHGAADMILARVPASAVAIPVGARLGDRASLVREPPIGSGDAQYVLGWYERGRRATVACELVYSWPGSIDPPSQVRLADLRALALKVERRVHAAVG